MSLFEYCMYNARKPLLRDTDVIEVPDYLLLEGEAAGDTVKRYMEGIARLRDEVPKLLP